MKRGGHSRQTDGESIEQKTSVPQREEESKAPSVKSAHVASTAQESAASQRFARASSSKPIINNPIIINSAALQR